MDVPVLVSARPQVQPGQRRLPFGYANATCSLSTGTWLHGVVESGLSSDLAGKHNSCRVLLRATEPNVGLKGHDLVTLILTYFGVTDCSAKTHGNRNIYNVVRATFKAICTHESLEEISLKRGKRLINLERAKRLQI